MRSIDGFQVAVPFFEFGPKAYMYGRAVLDLALRADALSAEYGVEIIFTPQYTDIRSVAEAVERVLVFAQHMDSLAPGRGTGAVLAEAVHDAGAVGVLLNHSERRLSSAELVLTMARASETGLLTMVCADDDAQAAAVAALGPDVIIVEAPDAIAAGAQRTEHTAIAQANSAIWRVNPDIRVLHGAGINCAQDVYDVIAAGAQGTGSSSAIVNAPDPQGMLEEMIKAVREAWNATNRE